ncbi:hypothetical protein MBLNU459_g6154t1 [Dothideomycetes sp. NU459]
MDTQMVFIHNSSANIPDEPVFGPRPPGNNNRTSGDPNGAFLGAEYDRAEALCDYIKHKNLGGRGWGFEGIVRMNAGFEMIWCDFESPSARLVSHLNTSVPLLDSQTGFSGSQSFMTKPASFIRKAQQALLPAERQLSKPPKTFLRNQPFQSSAALGWLTASVDRYGFVGGVPGRGEARVKLDSCGLFSFYDAGLTGQENSRINKEQRLLNLTSNGSWHAPDAESARKGALQSLMRRRRSHRADNVSVADGMYMHKAVEERLRAFASPGESGCSGIDWRLVAQEISLTYSANLHDILQLLQNVPANISTDTEQLLGWLSLVREMLHLLVMPYYEYPALATIRDSPDHAFGPNTDQARQAQRLCIGKHSPISLEDVTKTELFLYKATMEVTTAICHVVLTNFLSVEALWHGTTESSAVLTTRTATDIELTARNWRHSIEELTAWLGWADQWTTCKPGYQGLELTERTTDAVGGGRLEMAKGRHEGILQTRIVAMSLAVSMDQATDMFQDTAATNTDHQAVRLLNSGKGTPRRKVKKVVRSSGTDDKKLQGALKKMNVQPIQAIEEVNMFKSDGNVIHFAAPKVHASVPSNTFAIYGNGEDKELTELVPGILNQLGPDSLASLRKLAESYQSLQKGAEGEDKKEDDDDIPDLVEGESFENKADVE